MKYIFISLTALFILACRQDQPGASFLRAAGVSSTDELVEKTELILEGKNISDLPNDIDKLAKLKRLGLANNEIEELPQQLVGMASLEYLDLSGNPITVTQEYKKLLSDLVEKGVVVFNHEGRDFQGFDKNNKNKNGFTRKQLDEPLLQAMRSWDVKKGEFPPYNVSPQENKFINQMHNFIDNKGLFACYGIESASYFFEHVLPLYHVWPAPFCGVKGKVRSEFIAKSLVNMGYPKSSIFLFYDQRNIQEFLRTSDKHIMWNVSTHFDFPDWSSVKKLGELSHGVDTDGLFVRKHETQRLSSPYHDGLSLLFTRYNVSNYEPTKKIKQFYKVDSDKKTVLYLGTIGEWEFLYPGAPERVYENTLEALETINKNYNLILRPHPIFSSPSYQEFWSLLKEKFIIAPNAYFKSFVPFYLVADVIIGTPSAGGSTATCRPQLPMVQLLPEETWTKYGDTKINMRKVVETNGRYTLNHEKAVMVDDSQVAESSDAIVIAVETALTESPRIKQRKAAKRKQYFRDWFGCIDGYEEYRVILNYLRYYLKDIGIDELSELVATYNSFPVYRNGKFDVYKGSQCPVWDLYDEWSNK